MIDLVKLHQAATHAQVEGYLLKWNGSEIRQLVDQLQIAQKDAARYQWLRRWKGQEHEPPFTVQHDPDGTLWGADLDHYIDAAMAATKGEEA